MHTSGIIAGLVAYWRRTRGTPGADVPGELAARLNQLAHLRPEGICCTVCGSDSVMSSWPLRRGVAMNLCDACECDVTAYFKPPR